MNPLESPETGKSAPMKKEALPDNHRNPREGSHSIPSGVAGGKVPNRFLIKRHGRAET